MKNFFGNRWRKIKTFWRIALPFFKVCFFIALFGLALHITCIISPVAAGFLNRYLASPIRMVMSYATVWLPNSLSECLILLLPVILFFLLYIAWRVGEDSFQSIRYLSGLLGVLCLVYFGYVNGLGAPCLGPTIDTYFDLQQQNVSAQELSDTIHWVIEQTNEAAQQVDFAYGGFSKMPYDLNTMNKKLMVAYDDLHEENPFFLQFHSRTKPVIFSEAMSYTHMTGLYTFFTGEANINVAFPDYTIPYTAAHELAHQRGIARENEANFMAFMVMIRSEDPYLQYSAYLNMYEYLASALYSADYDLFAKAYSALSPSVIYEEQAYNAFFEKYQNSTASKVAETVNDTYLKASGQHAGTQSYGLVVDLTVAYYEANIK